MATSSRRTAWPRPICPRATGSCSAFRYGHSGRRVLQIAAREPELAAPIVEGHPDLLAEAVMAARLEQARSVADVLLRRTRLGLLAAPSCDRRVGAPVAEALGGELGGTSRASGRGRAWLADKAADGIDPAGGLIGAVGRAAQIVRRHAYERPRDLHLADLHDRAAEAGIEGYRKLGRDELIESSLRGRPSSPPAQGARRRPGERYQRAEVRR